MRARLLSVVLAVLVVFSLQPGTAFAATYYNRVCIDVDISFLDAAWGSRWTDDTVDKPGRGFKVYVAHGTSIPLVLDWPPPGTDAYVEVDGTWAGCTDDIAFDSNISYDITVWSEAKVDNITLTALNDDSPPEQAIYTMSGYSPTSDTDVGIVLDGTTARWNVLALSAFALVMHNPVTSTHTWEIRVRNCPGAPNGTSCAGELNQRVNIAHPHQKFIMGHELGHLVSFIVDAGGLGCNIDYTADEDGCDGSAKPQDGHGFLTKEYQSAAGCEGMAHFYSAITFNQQIDDCEVTDDTADFDLDGDPDYVNEPIPCSGDPLADNPDLVTDRDWLEDLVYVDDDNIDGVQCESSLAMRSTSYGWLEYFWGMWTVEQVDLPDIWDIWDAADPHDWNVAETGATADFAQERVYLAAYPTFLTEHNNQEVHGLDH